MKKASREYRDNLASELKNLRREGMREEATTKLNSEKGLISYNLSKALHRNRMELPEIDEASRRFDEETRAEGGFFFPNESNFYEVFPYVENQSGIGVGVGVDQMFDLFLHSRMEEVYITDITPRILFTSKALLEIGRRHKVIHGEYPKPNDFLKYLEKDNLKLTLEMLRSVFDEEDLELLRDQLNRKVGNVEDQSNPDLPEMVHYLLKYKSEQQNYDSWISNAKNLRRLIEAYEQGKIHIVRADIAGESSLAGLADHFNKQGKVVSTVYVSNALHYLGWNHLGLKSGDYRQFLENLGNLPVNDSSLLIVSSNQNSDESISDPYVRKSMMHWSYRVEKIDDVVNAHS